MLKCPTDRGALVRRLVPHTRHVGPYAFSGRVPGLVCKKCKESYIEGVDLAAFELRVAVVLADAGVASPEVLRYLRKAMGLLGKEFAQILGVRPETVSRWEAGGSIDRATYAVIRQILHDRLQGKTEMADYLRSLKKPKPLPREVKMRLAKAG
jgi:hypothetical protein